MVNKLRLATLTSFLVMANACSDSQPPVQIPQYQPDEPDTVVKNGELNPLNHPKNFVPLPEAHVNTSITNYIPMFGADSDTATRDGHDTSKAILALNEMWLRENNEPADYTQGARYKEARGLVAKTIANGIWAQIVKDGKLAPPGFAAYIDLDSPNTGNFARQHFADFIEHISKGTASVYALHVRYTDENKATEMLYNAAKAANTTTARNLADFREQFQEIRPDYFLMTDPNLIDPIDRLRAAGALPKDSRWSAGMDSLVDRLAKSHATYLAMPAETFLSGQVVDADAREARIKHEFWALQHAIADLHLYARPDVQNEYLTKAQVNTVVYAYAAPVMMASTFDNKYAPGFLPNNELSAANVSLAAEASGFHDKNLAWKRSSGTPFVSVTYNTNTDLSHFGSMLERIQYGNGPVPPVYQDTPLVNDTEWGAMNRALGAGCAGRNPEAFRCPAPSTDPIPVQDLPYWARVPHDVALEPELLQRYLTPTTSPGFVGTVVTLAREAQGQKPAASAAAATPSFQHSRL